VLHASAIPASPETAPDLPDLDYPIFRDDTDRAVDLDPLGLDGFYSQAPVRRRHVREVMTTLRLVTRRGHRHGVPDAATAVAMLRDIDPLLCRLQRHIPDLWRYDGLEELLLECAAVSGYPPRGNNYTYGTANPQDERARLFTGTDEERALYRGLALGESRLDDLLDALAACAMARLGTPPHTNAAGLLAGLWEPMVDAVRLMRKARVAPVMAVDIAPWVSNVLTIGGRELRGPTAAQLPVVAADWLLIGCDLDDPVYREYFRYYFAEQPPYRRRLVDQVLTVTGGRSLLTRIEQEWPRVPAAYRQDAVTALAGIDALFTRMIGFRVSHLNIAMPSLPKRERGATSWGSGSFDPEMLERLLGHTQDGQTRLRAVTA
jgi:hypothetical protein